MHTLVGWHLEMEFQEDGDRTKAVALVRLMDGTEVRGHGSCVRHHSDPPQLRVGEEVAGARALSDIASQLLAKAERELGEGGQRPSMPLM